MNERECFADKRRRRKPKVKTSGTNLSCGVVEKKEGEGTVRIFLKKYILRV